MHFTDKRFAVNFDTCYLWMVEGDFGAGRNDVASFAAHKKCDGFVGIKAYGVVTEVCGLASKVELMGVIDVAEETGLSFEVFVREVKRVDDIVIVLE